MAGVSGAALVVGGASGIGRACADALLAAGWPTVVADLRPSADDRSAVSFDVRDPRRWARRPTGSRPSTGASAPSCTRPAPRASRRCSTSTRASGSSSWASTSVAASTWSRPAPPHMPAGGSITLISSIDSAAPVAGLAHYSAAKAGAEALVRSAALELGPRGIRCNAVLPGVVRTPLMEPMLARPEVAEAFVAQTPLGRLGEGTDIADVVAFLASPEARWISGVSLPVDGGMSLREHPELLEEHRPS